MCRAHFAVYSSVRGRVLHMGEREDGTTMYCLATNNARTSQMTQVTPAAMWKQNLAGINRSNGDAARIFIARAAGCSYGDEVDFKMDTGKQCRAYVIIRLLFGVFPCEVMCFYLLQSD